MTFDSEVKRFKISKTGLVAGPSRFWGKIKAAATSVKIRGLLAALVLFVIVGPAGDSAAQAPPVFVTLSTIESQTFPQVTAFVYVTDSTERPVTGLTAADFGLAEDGLPVDPAQIISVESVSISGLQLVLALDLSTPEPNLSQVKAAAKTFVDTLQPNEQLALLVFYDQVTVAVDFTNDVQLLKTAIDALGYTGNYTAVEEATAKAATMAASRPGVRKAAILIPDIKNNIYTGPTGQAIQQAQAAGVPLYLISFPQKAQPGDFQTITAQVDGAVEIFLPEAGQVAARLLEIGSQLRQGYRLTYHSTLAGDNAEHTLTVAATYQGSRAQAQGSFVAISNQLLISLPGFTDGQAVSGTVAVTPQIRAVAPVESVAYSLDGAPLQTVTSPPFTLNWDTAAAPPGLHTLTAQAIDRAGNQGQTDIQLNVQPPLAVTVAASSYEINIGDTVTVQATVNSIAEVVRVDVLLDGNPLPSDEAAPTELSFSSNDYQPGPHLVTVQAEDSLGNVAMDSVGIDFLGPPPPPPSRIWWWLRLLGVILLILLALLLLLILALIIFRTRRQTEQVALTFANESNIANRYKVRAEAPAGGLEFQFALHGARLPVAVAPAGVAGQQGGAPNGRAAAGRLVETAGRAAPTGVAAPTTGAGPASSAGKGAAGPSPALAQTQQKLGCVAGALMPFTTLLSALMSFMPGSLAAPVQNWITQLQGVQSTAASSVSMTKTQVDSTQSAFEGVGQQVGSMSSAGGQTEAAPGPAGAAPAQGPAAGSVPSGPAYPAAATTSRPIQAAQTGGVPWAVTPPLDPGDKLTIDVLITPVDPNRSGEYPFKVISVLANQEEQTPRVEEGAIEVEKPFWVARVARLALYLFLAALIMASTALISLWLLQISLFDLPFL